MRTRPGQTFGDDMYVELHSRTRYHPKTKKLSRHLDITRNSAIGYITTLWMWVLDMAPDGDLSSFDEEDIEDAVYWDGPAGALVAAMVVVGLLDEGPDGLLVHDWTDYSQRLKAADRKRKERHRKQKTTHNVSQDKRDTGVTVTGQSQMSHDVTLTRPDQTRPDQTSPQNVSQDICDDPFDMHLTVDEIEREGRERFGVLNGEAKAILGQLEPIRYDHWELAKASQARTWAYAAKVVASAVRGEREREREIEEWCNEEVR